MAYYRALDISVGDNDLAHFKYIKRWKEGNEWRYQYPGDGASNTSASRNGGVTAHPGTGTQPIQKRSFGIREAMNYAQAKRQTRNFANYGAKAAQNYVDASKARNAAYENAAHPFRFDGSGSMMDKAKAVINTTKNTNSALKTLNTATAGYNQAKEYEQKAKSNFEKTTLGQASKQIQAGMTWISKMFKDFTAGAAPVARAVKEGIESASAAKKNKAAYDEYINGRNSDSPVNWDEYNRKQGMTTRSNYAKEHSEYTKARAGLNDTATGRAAAKVLDRAESYMNDKYRINNTAYRDPGLQRKINGDARKQYLDTQPKPAPAATRANSNNRNVMTPDERRQAEYIAERERLKRRRAGQTI